MCNHDLKYSYSFLKFKNISNLNSAKREAEKFFAQSEFEKFQFKQYDHPEIGYRKIHNKELYMLREKTKFPACAALAENLHQTCKKILENIAITLNLNPAVFLDLIDTNALPEKGYGNSLLRLNNYKIESCADDEILSEPHQDLGLLTLVCPTDVPALQIFDYIDLEWKNVEKNRKHNELIVMVGESLSTITNNYYLPATHQVAKPLNHRLSLVYHLRLRNDAILDSRLFESNITQKFSKPFYMTGEDYLKFEATNRISVNQTF